MAGSFAPFGRNIRRYEANQVGPRPSIGSALFTGGSGVVNSLRRLNDATPLGPVGGYSVVYDIGGDLYVGNSLVASGFSTNRKTYASFRPDASVQPWMYVGDSVKAVKVNASGLGYNTGIAEPQVPATTDLSGNQFCQYITGGELDIPFGTGSGPGFGGNPVFNAYLAVLWDFGDQGACSIVVPTAGMVAPETLLESGIIVGLDSLLAAPTNTTLSAFTFDNPATGGLATATIITAGTLLSGQIYQSSNGKYIHVVGTPWTFGAQTLFRTYVPLADVPAAGPSALTGVAGIKAFAPSNIPQTGTLETIQGGQTVTAGVGGIFIPGVLLDQNVDMEGRLIQGSDRVRFLAQVDVPGNVTTCKIYFNLDPQTDDFATNALVWTINGASFTSPAYINLSILVSSLTRIGTNIDLSLATGVTAIKFEWTVTGTVVWKMQSLSVIGNYGPTGSGSNAGISYRYVWRSSFLGSKSNPSPLQRTSINPTAAGVWVYPDDITPPTDLQVDVLDWYRIGGTLLNYTYVGTANIINGVIEPFLDDNDDLTVANNPILEFDNFEPFPSIDVPHNGIVEVNAYNVIWLSGDKFNIRWAPGSQITIAGRVFTLYKRPTDDTHLTVLENGGNQGGPYSLPRATLLAQRLPALWGPTDNTGFFFAVGDPLRPGTLYFTKGNNPDSAPDTNQIEVTSPSEPLINGVIMNGLAMVFSTERAWWIYPQFANVLATVIGTIGSPFYLIETISNRGLYAQNGICTDGGGRVFFVSKDGIYESAGGPGKCITDSIYTMFPHEGGPQEGMAINGDVCNPPDYANPNGMLLAFVDDRLYFDYVDADGNPLTLVYDIETGMWSQDKFDLALIHPTAHAPNEGAALGTLMGVSGAPNTTIRSFDPSGTEPVQMVAQPDFQEYQSPAWQHVKELNAEYQLPTGTANLQFIPDQGIAISSITVPTAANQIKSLLIAPAPNKFKLLQFILVATDPKFRMWTDGWEVKLGAWGRDTPYQVVKPFLRFGINVASE